MVWLKFGRGTNLLLWISWVMKSVFNEQVSAGSTLFVQNWSPFDSINLFTLFHIEYSLVIQQSLSNNHHCHQSKTSSNMIGLGEYKNIWCPFLHPYLLPDIFCCGRCGERLWGGNFSHVEKFLAISAFWWRKKPVSILVEKNFTFCVEKIGPKKLPVEKNDEYHVCIVYTHTQPMIWLPCDSCCFNDCKVRGKHILAISDSIAIFKYSSPAPPDNCRTINAFHQDLTVSFFLLFWRLIP